MKELDFLPEWYKDRRRRHSLVRKQYIALVAVFLMMVTFNTISAHRVGQVAAEVARHDDQRLRAEGVVHEFTLVTGELNQIKTKADLVQRIDARIDIAAILAEISHIVDESVVLSRIELVAEPFTPSEERDRAKAAFVRSAGTPVDGRREPPLGNPKLRVVLAGMAIHPSHVADLVCRLDESSYFHQVRPSFYGRAKVPGDAAGPAQARADTAGVTAPEMPGVTAFEITCYLANYEEIGGQ